MSGPTPESKNIWGSGVEPDCSQGGWQVAGGSQWRLLFFNFIFIFYK